MCEANNINITVKSSFTNIPIQVCFSFEHPRQFVHLRSALVHRESMQDGLYVQFLFLFRDIYIMPNLPQLILIHLPPH